MKKSSEFVALSRQSKRCQLQIDTLKSAKQSISDKLQKAQAKSEENEIQMTDMKRLSAQQMNDLKRSNGEHLETINKLKAALKEAQNSLAQELKALEVQN